MRAMLGGMFEVGFAALAPCVMQCGYLGSSFEISF